MKARLILLLIAIGFSTDAILARADNEKNRELGEVQAKIQLVGADIRSISAEKTAQQEELKKLEKKYGELANALQEIKANINQQEESLQQVRSKIATTQKELQLERRVLEGLIKAAYAIGTHETLSVILNQQDASSSGRMLVYRDYLSKARAQKLLSVQESVKTLRQLEAEMTKENQLLQVTLDKKKQETEKMQALKIQREKVLAELDSSYTSKNEQMASLLHDKKKLESLVATLQKTDDNAELERKSAPSVNTQAKTPPKPEIEKGSSRKQPKPENESSPKKLFVDLQGQLPWPVQGVITERFGSRRFETTWDGDVISAREGSDIHAVAAGRVVYADWLRGYGLMLIVEHGKGYMSLYAFNQNLHKSVGELVKAGDTLASVGRSGGRSQAALYFGIRSNGRPVDPELWCRKPAKN